MLSTENMGGVVVTESQLRAMQTGDYVLHARDGKLEKVEVEKTWMPLDPQGHVQRLGLVLAPDGTIYASQHTIISRSTDGARTWEHLPRDPAAFGFSGWMLQVDTEGRLINISQQNEEELTTVWASVDEGETWAQMGSIDVAPFRKTVAGHSLTRLSDGALLLPIKECDESFHEGTNPTYAFRSDDGGRTFTRHSFLSDYGNEVNITELFPGRLLAVIRYQPGPPDRPESNKTVFLADSTDKGSTWVGHRQLTSEEGQCHGAAVGLSGNRAVVAYDHRYPRNMASARAMLSHDHGQNWQDEVYYLCHGNAAGFTRHITLDGEEILTLVGSCYGDVGQWENATGNSRFCIIRWRPV